MANQEPVLERYYNLRFLVHRKNGSTDTCLHVPGGITHDEKNQVQAIFGRLLDKLTDENKWITAEIAKETAEAAIKGLNPELTCKHLVIHGTVKG
jgi:hypothetical protein